MEAEVVEEEVIETVPAAPEAGTDATVSSPPAEPGELEQAAAQTLPPGFWGEEDEPPEAPQDQAKTAGEGNTASLLEHPRFKLVQELFPGRLIAYNETREDESPLTDEEAAVGIHLELSETDDEGETA